MRGLHARGQVIAFDSAWRHGSDKLERALNATLPGDISVRHVEQAPAGFHPRYSAVSRVYFYNLYHSQTRIPVLERHYHWQRRALDIDAMDQAARLLLGEHDMAAFGQPTVGTVTIRRVMQSFWRRIEMPAYLAAPHMGQALQFVVEANGFLRGMVRRMVGFISISPITIAVPLSISSSSAVRRDLPGHGSPASEIVWRISPSTTR